VAVCPVCSRKRREKDFWVCFALQHLFGLPGARDYFIFKGGTSLAKVWRAIHRFSEDIDISLTREWLGFTGERDPESARTRTQRARLLTALSAACAARVREELARSLEGWGFGAPSSPLQRSTQQPGVEDERLGLSANHLGKIRVGGVEKKVEFPGYDCAGQGQNRRLRRFDPKIADFLRGRRRRFGPPVVGQFSHRKPRNHRCVERHANGDILEADRRVQVDQTLQRRQGFRLAAIDDRNSTGVPASAVIGRTLAGEGRGCVLGLENAPSFHDQE